MSVPGAKRVMHLPKLEYPALASFDVVAPTEITRYEPPGELLQAFLLSFPAAATTTTPRFTRAAMEVSTVATRSPKPKLMDATDGRPVFSTAFFNQSRPFKRLPRVPDPLSFKILIEMMRAFLATPVFTPPMVPAQCVPWPSPSAQSLLNTEKPHLARFSNS